MTLRYKFALGMWPLLELRVTSPALGLGHTSVCGPKPEPVVGEKIAVYF